MSLNRAAGVEEDCRNAWLQVGMSASIIQVQDDFHVWQQFGKNNSLMAILVKFCWVWRAAGERETATQSRPTLISVRLGFGAPFHLSRLQMVELQKVLKGGAAVVSKKVLKENYEV